MIWLFKKIFGIIITIAIIFFALHLQVGGRQAKDYVLEAWKSPIVQGAVEQGKQTIMGYLNKDVAPAENMTPPMEHLEDDDRQELDKILQEKSKSR